MAYPDDMGRVIMKKPALALFIIFALATVASADYRDKFRKEFLMSPWAVTQSRVNACIECHTSLTMREDLRGIPDEWRKSWHFQNYVDCQGCHGGDPGDAKMSMSHNRGFIGSPKREEIPDFCGKCHIGILEIYRKSGHGRGLSPEGQTPVCVTCHGSHNIQKGSIDIINEQRCTQCHTYERAKVIRQALFVVEKQIVEVAEKLNALKNEGVLIEREEKSHFSTHMEFGMLFHTIDVELVKERTDEFTERLNKLDARLAEIFKELSLRENIATFFFLLFLCLFVVVIMLSRTYDGEQ